MKKLFLLLPMIVILLCFCAKQTDVSETDTAPSSRTESPTQLESEPLAETGDETETENETSPSAPTEGYFIESSENAKAEADKLIRDLRSKLWSPLYEDYTIKAGSKSHNFIDLSIYYENIETGLSIYYRSDYSRPAASVVKAPLALAILEKAQSERPEDAPSSRYDEYGLSHPYTYRASDFVPGTGTIQYMDEGTEFTNLSLMELMITRSDCIALNQITKYYHHDDLHNLVSRLELTGMKDTTANMSCRDGAKIMKEVLSFYQSGSEYGKMLFGWMSESDECIITHTAIGSETVIAHKYGFDMDGMHDMALVMRESPYVLTIMTNYISPSRNQYEYLYSIVRTVDEINKYARVLSDTGEDTINLK